MIHSVENKNAWFQVTASKNWLEPRAKQRLYIVHFGDTLVRKNRFKVFSCSRKWRLKQTSNQRPLDAKKVLFFLLLQLFNFAERSRKTRGPKTRSSIGDHLTLTSPHPQTRNQDQGYDKRLKTGRFYTLIISLLSRRPCPGTLWTSRTDMSKLRPAGRMRPSNLFLRPLNTFLRHVEIMLKLSKIVQFSLSVNVKNDHRRKNWPKKFSAP